MSLSAYIVIAAAVLIPSFAYAYALDRRAQRAASGELTILRVRAWPTATPNLVYHGDLILDGSRSWWVPAGTSSVQHLPGLRLTGARKGGTRLSRALSSDPICPLFDTVLGDGTQLTFTTANRHDTRLLGGLAALAQPQHRPSYGRPQHQAHPAGKWPRWVSVTAVTGLLCLLAAFAQPTAGRMVPAQVVAAVADSNNWVTTVRWTDPWNGTTRTDTVTPYNLDGDHVGEQVNVQVLPWPMDSQAWNGSAVLSTLGLLAAASAGVTMVGATRARRRRRQSATAEQHGGLLDTADPLQRQLAASR